MYFSIELSSLFLLHGLLLCDYPMFFISFSCMNWLYAFIFFSVAVANWQRTHSKQFKLTGISSRLFTNSHKGRPKHLIEDKYFLDLDPAISSNWFGVNHSNWYKIHFLLLPDSNVSLYILAGINLHVTVKRESIESLLINAHSFTKFLAY